MKGGLVVVVLLLFAMPVAAVPPLTALSIYDLTGAVGITLDTTTPKPTDVLTITAEAPRQLTAVYKHPYLLHVQSGKSYGWLEDVITNEFTGQNEEYTLFSSGPQQIWEAFAQNYPADAVNPNVINKVSGTIDLSKIPDLPAGTYKIALVYLIGTEGTWKKRGFVHTSFKIKVACQEGERKCVGRTLQICTDGKILEEQCILCIAGQCYGELPKAPGEVQEEVKKIAAEEKAAEAPVEEPAPIAEVKDVEEAKPIEVKPVPVQPVVPVIPAKEEPKPILPALPTKEITTPTIPVSPQPPTKEEPQPILPELPTKEITTPTIPVSPQPPTKEEPKPILPELPTKEITTPTIPVSPAPPAKEEPKPILPELPVKEPEPPTKEEAEPVIEQGPKLPALPKGRPDIKYFDEEPVRITETPEAIRPARIVEERIETPEFIVNRDIGDVQFDKFQKTTCAVLTGPECTAEQASYNVEGAEFVATVESVLQSLRQSDVIKAILGEYDQGLIDQGIVDYDILERNEKQYHVFERTEEGRTQIATVWFSGNKVIIVKGDISGDLPGLGESYSMVLDAYARKFPSDMVAEEQRFDGTRLVDLEASRIKFIEGTPGNRVVEVEFCIDGDQSINDLKKNRPITEYPFAYLLSNGEVVQRYVGASGEIENWKNKCGTITFTLNPADEPVYQQARTLKIIVDPEGVIDETNENNNILTLELEANYFEITELRGLQPGYEAYETIDVKIVTIIFPEGESASIVQGMHVQYEIENIETGKRYAAGNAVLTDKGEWLIKLRAPRDPGAYALAVHLYCSRDDAECTERWGGGAQVDGLYKFAVMSRKEGIISPLCELDMVWYSDGKEIRRDAYDPVNDECESYRCIEGDAIGLACVLESICARDCDGTCKQIAEMKRECILTEVPLLSGLTRPACPDDGIQDLKCFSNDVLDPDICRDEEKCQEQIYQNYCARHGMSCGGGTTEPPVKLYFEEAPANGEITSDTAYVVMRTNVPSSAEVHYGTTKLLGNTAQDDQTRERNIVKLQDLEPGTKYYYRVIVRDPKTGDSLLDTNQGEFYSFYTPIIETPVIPGGQILIEGVRDFDGTNPIATGFGVTKPFAMSAWINPTQSSVLFDANGRYTTMRTYIQNSELYYSHFDNANGNCVYAKGGAPIGLNEWSHIAVTMHNDGTMDAYVNGKKAPGFAKAISPASGGTDFKIGKGAAGQACMRSVPNNFKGQMSNVQYFQRGLADAEILELSENVPAQLS